MTEPTKLPMSKDEDMSAPDPGRRRLVRGGLGAAPVLMTLVSRPALGHGYKCFSPSGFVSMPTSEHGQPKFCSGRTPGYWKQPQHFDEWPKPYYPVNTKYKTATKFKDVFSPTLYPWSTTLLQVLELQAGPPNDVARHIVAALLNVKKGWTPVLTIESVKGIWTQYASTGGGITGYFEPTAGVKWYHDEITAYLKSTMPL